MCKADKYGLCLIKDTHDRSLIPSEVNEAKESADGMGGTEGVEMVKWIKEKLPYWKALLRCWDDVTSAFCCWTTMYVWLLCAVVFTSHVMEEHCDPDASRDVRYANRLLTSAQRELFSQLTKYISVWARAIAKNLLNRCVRFRFLKTLLELVSLKDELLVKQDPKIFL